LFEKIFLFERKALGYPMKRAFGYPMKIATIRLQWNSKAKMMSPAKIFISTFSEFHFG